MIFNTIEINNFGIYSGNHTVRLTPENKDKPIILFGGLNGGGKTTLLDAFNLALYGKNANCSNRGAKPYFEYLEKTINTNPNGSDTYISLSFSRIESGKNIDYKITRSYNLDSISNKKEKFIVEKQGTNDEVLTESWDEYVLEILPPQIASLFFFDGEKIEQLADPQNSAELLSIAVSSLFGVDVIDKLSIDLNTFEHKKLTSNKKSDQSAELEKKLQIVEKVKLEAAALRQNKSSLNSQKSRLEAKLTKIKKVLKNNGGDVFFQREEIEKQLNTAIKHQDVFMNEIMKLISGSMPLFLVQDLIKRTSDQSNKEHNKLDNEIISNILDKRDSALINLLNNKKVDNSILEEIKSFLNESKSELNSNNDENFYIDLQKEDHDLLISLTSQLTSDYEKALILLKELEVINEDIELNQRRLSTVPDESTIVDILNEITHIEEEIIKVKKQNFIVEEDLRRKLFEEDLVKRDFIKLSDKALNNVYLQEDNKRMIEHSKRVKSNLSLFKNKIIRKKLLTLENIILESFSFLIRKEDFISSITIDPESFSIEMTNSEGSIITPERLSAGERQLLATSILWGLAKASGRPIPTIIDTPLGRLDSKHREKLVNSYFPNASHQVILLSTDTEITEDEYNLIKDQTSFEYTLEYDKQLKSTVVNPGYFYSKAGVR